MQFCVTGVRRAQKGPNQNTAISTSRSSVEDRLAQIQQRLAESDSKELTPQEFDYLMKHIDRLPDELQPAFLAAIRTRGLPEDLQVQVLQIDPEWVAHLPDVGAAAQRWLLNRGRNLQELMEKIPKLTHVSPQLLRYAVNSHWATPEIIKYLIVQYGKELQGMQLRKTALLHSPEIVKDLPSTVMLSSDEMKALMQLDPSNYQYFRKPDPSVQMAYRKFLRETRKQADESAVFELGETPLADLVDDLKEAEARGETVAAHRIRERIARIRAELDSVLPQNKAENPDPTATDDSAATTSKSGDDEDGAGAGPDAATQPVETSQQAEVDRTDLTGYVLQGGGRKFLVLQDIPVHGTLPSFVQNMVPDDAELTPDRVYRVLDLGSRMVYVLIPDSQFARVVRVTGKYANGLFSQTVSKLRSDEEWKPQAALGPNFRPLAESQTPDEDEDVDLELTAGEDPEAPEVEPDDFSEYDSELESEPESESEPEDEEEVETHKKEAVPDVKSAIRNIRQFTKLASHMKDLAMTWGGTPLPRETSKE